MMRDENLLSITLRANSTKEVSSSINLGSADRIVITEQAGGSSCRLAIRQARGACRLRDTDAVLRGSLLGNGVVAFTIASF
jgi:hypothetical protein